MSFQINLQEEIIENYLKSIDQEMSIIYNEVKTELEEKAKEKINQQKLYAESKQKLDLEKQKEIEEITIKYNEIISKIYKRRGIFDKSSPSKKEQLESANQKRDQELKIVNEKYYQKEKDLSAQFFKN
ncbi:hypothetical protein M0811_02628 [Anaeramoeba ignava]|uniref:Uncharacterized protein n=1 Tax=Anaeramoeba ignava TaxID=1746090 RepID=A0A9Q0LB39_ANAIG|nr:hypothetical protein M0811_02628 [Anaeramoeba ignava]